MEAAEVPNPGTGDNIGSLAFLRDKPGPQILWPDVGSTMPVGQRKKSDSTEIAE
jgi:hypothetical protein